MKFLKALGFKGFLSYWGSLGEKMLLQIGIVILGIAAFFIIVMIVDCHRLVIREYSVPMEHLQRNVSFVLLSDMHSTVFGKNNSKLIEKVKQCKPEFIVTAGDMYTAVKSENGEKAADTLKLLQNICQVYAIDGNHEQKTKQYPDLFDGLYRRYTDDMNRAGIKVLSNEHVYLEEEKIYLYGLELPCKYYKKFKKHTLPENFVKDSLGECPEAPVILMAHNPEFFDEYAKWGAKLSLCGHIHGGLMVLPFLGGVVGTSLNLFPKYDGGLFEEYDSHMILSRGLGTHTLPIRIFNPGEVISITLTPKK